MTTTAYEDSGMKVTPPASSLGAFAAGDRDAVTDRKSLNGRDNNPSRTTLTIRRLPRNTTSEAVKTMLLFAKDLLETELVPNEHPEDNGFVTARARFSSSTGASEAQTMLDGKPNATGHGTMIVEMVPNSGSESKRRNIMDGDGARDTSQPISPSSAPHAKPSRFNGTFQSIEKLSPPPVGSPLDQSHIDMNSHMQDFFSPRLPNHLQDRSRMSGKTMIGDDLGDDETGELLRDPLAYMKNDGNGYYAGSRQANGPRLPVSAFNGLSLNTNLKTPTLPSYTSPRSATHAQMTSGIFSPGGGAPYHGSGNHYMRHNYPPVNPADQNPPCNTLYVGNLPMDTSEDELKSMFSKQRGYKRLCFRTKQNGPMCFVEFEDISFATKALHELYGVQLHNSVKGGIRLSFSKNPLGVRSGQAGSGNTSVPYKPGANLVNNMSPMSPGSFSAVSGPPPGLSAPSGVNMGSPGNGGPVNGHYFSQNSPMAHPPPAAPHRSAGLNNGSGNLHGGNGFPGFMMGR